MNPHEIRDRLIELDNQRRRSLRSRCGGTNSSISYVDADNIHGTNGRGALEMFQEYQRLTDEMNQLRVELKGYVGTFDNLTDQILFLVNIYGMSQKETSEYLGYSYDYVRQVYSKNSQKITQSQM